MPPITASEPHYPALLGARARTRLPHFDHRAAVQHIVFRLADALPANVLMELRHEQPADRIDAAEAVLDAGAGSRALAEPAAAAVVVAALRHFDGQRYHLRAWCVMPTHVHVLAMQQEGWPRARVVQGWKSFTSRLINHRLDLAGRLWAPNYFDRYMRDDGHFKATRAYIEANPVNARLCAAASDWPWSSATVR